MTTGAHFPPVSLGPISPRGGIGTTVDDTAARRVTDTAKEFEATFLTMLLKEMRQTLEPDGGLFPGDTGDVQGGLFDLYLGKHLADSGGVGLSAALERQLQNTYAPATGHRPPPARAAVAGATVGRGAVSA